MSARKAAGRIPQRDFKKAGLFQHSKRGLVKHSLLTVILAAVISLSFGFGLASLFLVGQDHSASAAGSSAAESAPIDTAPIVAIDNNLRQRFLR